MAETSNVAAYDYARQKWVHGAKAALPLLIAQCQQEIDTLQNETTGERYAQFLNANRMEAIRRAEQTMRELEAEALKAGVKL